MAQEYRLIVPAVLEKVEEICQFVADVAGSAGMSHELIHRCYLAVEEVCTNIVEHGYHYRGNDNVIEILCRDDTGLLQITVIDDALPFNPLDRDDPDPNAPLLEREGGGWGIFFVKKYMDRVWYDYSGQRNHLTLEKSFEPA
jgi:sigma-B regulation protein RsbU (phosphoserine phosphatase)